MTRSSAADSSLSIAPAPMVAGISGPPSPTAPTVAANEEIARLEAELQQTRAQLQMLLAERERSTQTAEAALRKSELQLTTILQNIPAAVYMLSPEQRYLYVNRYYEQENQITNAEIRGLSVYDRWPRAYAEILAANERQILASKVPTKIEEAVPRAGGMRYYETIKAPLLNEAGEPYAIIGISTDITERKAAEAALRRSEERYRTLFETMDEGFCVLELIFDAANKPLDYRFLEVNPAFARFTGLEDALGKTARQLVPNLEAHWVEIYGQVALTGESRRFIEGSATMGRWFEVYAFRFGAPENHQVALLFTNITERKQAEEQLRGQEELLHQIADNVPGLIGYVGQDECYRFVNATFESWFQRPRQQIVGNTVAALIGEVERARLSNYRQEALAGKTISYETLFTYPDGVTRTVWGRYQPHLAPDGTVLGFYLFVMDISERKRAEEALQQFNEQLEQQVHDRTAQLERSNRELDQFAYVASHDLKAPLRGINHLATWITDDADGVLPATSRAHLAKLRERVQRMERLLDDLLIYSRVGRRDGTPEVVNTAALVSDIVALLAPPPDFTVHIIGELPDLVTPKTPLEIVLRNLIGNVLKHHHTPQSGAVWISAQTQDNFVEFCVRDNGPGIDPQYHERIFGVFQTLQPRDQVEGSGMGLALVKKTVEYQGGRVRVASAEKQGAAFYFTWPKIAHGSDDGR